MTFSRRALSIVVVQAVIVLAASSAQAKPVRVGVTAIGTATDSDRSSSVAQSKDNAKASLVCAGRLEDVEANPTGCVQVGSDESKSFVCTAVARGTCVIGG
jgi:hypothetical protein